MKISFFKRAVAGAILGGGLLLAAPSIAAADTLVYEGRTPSGSYKYVNAQTGFRFQSASFMGNVYETHCK